MRAFPDRGGTLQVFSDGELHTAWLRNGSELVSRPDDNRVMAVSDIANAEAFVPDKPRLWTDGQFMIVAQAGEYSFVAYPDDKRIAVLIPADTPESHRARAHVRFVLNFGDELRREAPGGG